MRTVIFLNIKFIFSTNIIFNEFQFIIKIEMEKGLLFSDFVQILIKSIPSLIFI